MLQFDRVTPAAAGDAGQIAEAGEGSARATCAVCKRPIEDVYFGLGKDLVCLDCKDALDLPRPGSKVGRYVRAVAYGLGGGFAGALLWYAVMKVTGLQLGLIAVVVGFLVGSAVRAGSRGHGGAAYGLTAVVITYLSVGLTYTAIELPRQLKRDEASTPSAAVATRGAATQGAASPAAAREAHPDDTPKRDSGAALAILISVVAPIMIVVLPVMTAIESPISGLIVAFALWEAWKLNRKIKLAFRGPFELGGAAAGRSA